MRRRFFVDQVRNGQAQIEGDDARHLTRVLRVEAGQQYEISDNRNVYLAEIETARKEMVVFQALEKLAAPPLRAVRAVCRADQVRSLRVDGREGYGAGRDRNRSRRSNPQRAWAGESRRTNAWSDGAGSRSKRASNRAARIFRRSPSRFRWPRPWRAPGPIGTCWMRIRGPRRS